MSEQETMRRCVIRHLEALAAECRACEVGAAMDGDKLKVGIFKGMEKTYTDLVDDVKHLDPQEDYLD